MGTGPGEIWVGPGEIKVAYEYFFEGFDKGEQSFEYQFKIGGVSASMGWLMAVDFLTCPAGHRSVISSHPEIKPSSGNGCSAAAAY
jgi:hypothetical protein